MKAAQSSGLQVEAAFVLSRLKPNTTIGRDFIEVLNGEGLPVLPAGTHDRTAYAAALSSYQISLNTTPAAEKHIKRCLPSLPP